MYQVEHRLHSNQLINNGVKMLSAKEYLVEVNKLKQDHYVKNVPDNGYIETQILNL